MFAKKIGFAVLLATFVAISGCFEKDEAAAEAAAAERAAAEKKEARRRMLAAMNNMDDMDFRNNLNGALECVKSFNFKCADERIKEAALYARTIEHEAMIDKTKAVSGDVKKAYYAEKKRREKIQAERERVARARAEKIRLANEAKRKAQLEAQRKAEMEAKKREQNNNPFMKFAKNYVGNYAADELGLGNSGIDGVARAAVQDVVSGNGTENMDAALGRFVGEMGDGIADDMGLGYDGSDAIGRAFIKDTLEGSNTNMESAITGLQAQLGSDFANELGLSHDGVDAVARGAIQDVVQGTGSQNTDAAINRLKSQLGSGVADEMGLSNNGADAVTRGFIQDTVQGTGSKHTEIALSHVQSSFVPDLVRETKDIVPGRGSSGSLKHSGLGKVVAKPSNFSMDKYYELIRSGDWEAANGYLDSGLTGGSGFATLGSGSEIDSDRILKAQQEYIRRLESGTVTEGDYNHLMEVFVGELEKVSPAEAKRIQSQANEISSGDPCKPIFENLAQEKASINRAQNKAASNNYAAGIMTAGSHGAQLASASASANMDCMLKRHQQANRNRAKDRSPQKTAHSGEKNQPSSRKPVTTEISMSSMSFPQVATIDVSKYEPKRQAPAIEGDKAKRACVSYVKHPGVNNVIAQKRYSSCNNQTDVEDTGDSPNEPDSNPDKTEGPNSASPSVPLGTEDENGCWSISSDQGCVSTVAEWSEFTKDMLKVHFTNHCPKRVYIRGCIERINKDPWCALRGIKSGETATISDSPATGAYTFTQTGSVNAQSDWVCASKVGLMRND